MFGSKPNLEITEKTAGDQLIASIRYKGKYGDCGEYIGGLYRAMGGAVSGKPFNLYYDKGYVEENADIETCLPLRKEKKAEGISVRILPGGRCVSLIHKGPYDTLGESYGKLTEFIKEKGIRVEGPCREIYLKGPGMLFRGNPKNYLTEIQMMIAE